MGAWIASTAGVRKATQGKTACIPKGKWHSWREPISNIKMTKCKFADDHFSLAEVEMEQAKQEDEAACPCGDCSCKYVSYGNYGHGYKCGSRFLSSSCSLAQTEMAESLIEQAKEEEPSLIEEESTGSPRSCEGNWEQTSHGSPCCNEYDKTSIDVGDGVSYWSRYNGRFLSAQVTKCCGNIISFQSSGDGRSLYKYCHQQEADYHNSFTYGFKYGW
jgi:hypothetical protein